MSRRGNGLTAETYTALADLPPQLADVMLTALRDEGIAAYAIPYPGEVGGYLDIRSPGAPTDRLYVDLTAKEDAERVLGDRIPALEFPDLDEEHERTSTAEPDDDAVWAEIVASFNEPVMEGEVPWPDEENIDEPVEPAEPAYAHVERPAGARVVKPAVEDEDEDDDKGDDEDHYIPPPPPPLPRPDPVTFVAWLALLGGPLYLMASVFLHWDGPTWASFAAIAAFIGGFVVLVLRMGDDSPHGPDDGAVV